MTSVSVAVVHPRLGSLAVCVDRELAIHCGQSLRLVQRIPEATGCEDVAWHPQGPSLVAFVPGASSAAVMLFTSGGAADTSDCRQLRCVHTYHLPWAGGLGGAGVCLGEGHLLVGGADLSVWGCSFAPWPEGALPEEGAHLLHCAEEPDLQQAMGHLGPVTRMSLDGSARFLATLHGHAESAARVWWAASGEDDAHGHGVRPARREVPGRGRLPRSTAEAKSPVGGTCVLLLSHGEPLVDVSWAPSAAGSGSCHLAVIATLTAGGTVTVWRESAPETPLAFLVEALWHPGELWAGAPSCAVAARCSFRWAALGRCWSLDERPEVASATDWGDRPGLPLRSSGHPAGVAEGPLSTGRPFCHAGGTSMLVLLRGDGQTASVHLQAGCAGATSAVQPLAVRHAALPSLAAVGGCTAAAQCSSSLLHVDAEGAAAKDALELLLGRGSDVYRVRLEDGERATVLAVAGGLLGGEPQAGPGPHGAERPGAAEPLAVRAVEVHRTLGFVACLMQGAAEEGASTVWIGEVPCGRASLAAGRHAVPRGALQRGSLGSLQVGGGARELRWAPGSVVPPVLAVGRAGGELLACAVDPVRGVVGPGAWAAVLRGAGGPAVRGVQTLGTASEADGERAMLCLLSLPEAGPAAPELTLARLSVPAGGGAPHLEVFFVHQPSAPCLALRRPRACLAVEWLGAPPQLAAEGPAGPAPAPGGGEGLLGQIAVCCAGEGADGPEAADPRVYTLASGDQGVCARDALSAHVGPHGHVLGLALHGEWLAAVASSAEVLIWRLTAAVEAGAGCEPTAQVFQRIPLFTRRVHLGGAPPEGAGALAARHRGDAGQGRELGSARAALHRFAGGGLGMLVSGSSETDVALPMVIVRTRSAGEGEIWPIGHGPPRGRAADERPRARLEPRRRGGARRAGRRQGSRARGAAEARAAGVEAAGQRAVLAGQLRAVPCVPSDGLPCVAAEDMHAAQHIMRSLLAVLSAPRPMGIQPLLDVSLDELHAAKASAGGPPPEGPDVGAAAAEAAGATADSLFGGEDSEDEFEARLARLRRAFEDGAAEEETGYTPTSGSACTLSGRQPEFSVGWEPHTIRVQSGLSLY
ncbi:unnamed protein product, partial [Prorocentrum cordatum]